MSNVTFNPPGVNGAGPLPAGARARTPGKRS
jgi:hypothetical protein